MTLPVTPGSSLSLSQIQTEFGGANPISINEYYSGGSYVGSGIANSGGVTIPTSGTISFSNFSGATAIITLYNGGTVQGKLARVDDSGTTGFGNPIGYTDYFGWYNNNGTAPSPATLTDGKTISGWYNFYHYTWVGGTTYTLNSSGSVILISGFGSTNPGYTYITSAKLGSSTLLTTTSPGYTFGGGVGSWTMSGGMFTIGQTGTYTGYIYR